MATTTNSIVLKSQYEYFDATKDDSILTFTPDERFVMIKEPDADNPNWYYVVNKEGKVGYVPDPYVSFDQVMENFAFFS